MIFESRRKDQPQDEPCTVYAHCDAGGTDAARVACPSDRAHLNAHIADVVARHTADGWRFEPCLINPNGPTLYAYCPDHVAPEHHAEATAVLRRPSYLPGCRDIAEELRCLAAARAAIRATLGDRALGPEHYPMELARKPAAPPVTDAR